MKHSKQLHTARKQECKRVQIYYPFHPRCKEQLNAICCKKFRGEKHFVIKHPDGTLGLLPIWMTNPESANFQITLLPYISLDTLIELQKVINDYHHTSNSFAQLLGGNDEHIKQGHSEFTNLPETNGKINRRSNRVCKRRNHR